MSAFWKRKLKTSFDRFDVDRDGHLTQKDFEALAEKLIVAQRLDLERGIKLKEALIEIWSMMFKETSEDKSCNLDQYVTAAKEQLEDEHFRNLCSTVFTLWFTAIDVDADGIIQEEEFIHFFKALDIASEAAKVSFKALDSNHDGFLALAEYVAAGMDFVTSEDETSLCKLFWGPLVS